MNHFITSLNFTQAAKDLDPRRLSNQINECLITLRTLTGWYAPGKGWPHHPNVRRWAGYEAALCKYSLDLLEEFNQHTKQDCNPRAYRIIEALSLNLKQYEEWRANTWIYPPWLNDDYCAECRRVLLAKNPGYYQNIFGGIPHRGMVMAVEADKMED